MAYYGRKHRQGPTFEIPVTDPLTGQHCKRDDVALGILDERDTFAPRHVSGIA